MIDVDEEYTEEYVREEEALVRELVAQRVRAKRTSSNLSVLRLAELAGMDHKTVQKIERQKSNVTLSTLARLSVALEMPVYLFFAPERIWRQSEYYVEGKKCVYTRRISRKPVW